MWWEGNNRHHSFSERLLGLDWFDRVSHTCLTWMMSLNEVICLVTWCSHNCYFHLSVQFMGSLLCVSLKILTGMSSVSVHPVQPLLYILLSPPLSILLWVCDCVGASWTPPKPADAAEEGSSGPRHWRSVQQWALRPPTHFPLDNLLASENRTN